MIAFFGEATWVSIICVIPIISLLISLSEKKLGIKLTIIFVSIPVLIALFVHLILFRPLANYICPEDTCNTNVIQKTLSEKYNIFSKTFTVNYISDLGDILFFCSSKDDSECMDILSSATKESFSKARMMIRLSRWLNKDITVIYTKLKDSTELIYELELEYMGEMSIDRKWKIYRE